MIQRISISFVCLLGLLVSGTLFSGEQAYGHDCIEALLLRSPTAVTPGQQFGAQVGVFNCGRRDAAVAVNMYLVTDDLRRIHIGDTLIRVRTDSRGIVVVRCQIPDRATPGRYQLVMAASTRGGALELDRKRILVVHRDPGDRDLDRVITEVLDSHGDKLGQDSLIAMVDDIMNADLEEKEIGDREIKLVPKYFHGEVDYVKRDDNDEIISVRVVDGNGKTKTFDCDSNTLYPNGEPVVGDKVKVTYKNRLKATEVKVK